MQQLIVLISLYYNKFIHYRERKCCEYFASCRNIQDLSGEKFSIYIQPQGKVQLTLSKPAYEQVLKTLENISYSGDINADLIQNAGVAGNDVNVVDTEDGKGSYLFRLN